MAVISIDNLVDNAFSLGAIQVKEELCQIASFLVTQSPRHIMEIGSEAGGTFYLWCQLASGKKLSVDLPSGASGSGRFTDPAAFAQRSQSLESFGDEVYLITGDSHCEEVFRQVKETLDGDKLDFLFIDGDHSYEGVKADFEVYGPLVRPGGSIAFHDIRDTEYHRIRGCNVGKLWKELTGDKWEFLGDQQWGGIGLLKV